MREYTPAPWQWKWEPSTHSLDYPRRTPDRYWDGIHDEGGSVEDLRIGLNFDALEGGLGTFVLHGIWHNDDTAGISVGGADARLIAAAPELFDALANLFTASENMEGISREAWQKVLSDARQAMHKAVGS